MLNLTWYYANSVTWSVESGNCSDPYELMDAMYGKVLEIIC